MPALTSLGPEHRAAMSAHMLALDTLGRCDRFLAAVHDDYLLRYVQSIDFQRDLLIGAFEGPVLVGLVHAGVALEGAEPNEFNLSGGPSAEVGISVLASHRRHGLGRLLVRAVLDAAQARGIARVEVLFRSTNQSMAALTRSMGGHIEHRGAESHSVFELL